MLHAGAFQLCERHTFSPKGVCAPFLVGALALWPVSQLYMVLCACINSNAVA